MMANPRVPRGSPRGSSRGQGTSGGSQGGYSRNTAMGISGSRAGDPALGRSKGWLVDLTADLWLSVGRFVVDLWSTICRRRP